jgi:hypothetical protein
VTALGQVLDTKRLITEMARRYGVRIDESDPALAIVLLNQLALEAIVEHVGDVMLERIRTFDESIEKVERRGGNMLARSVKDSCAQLRTELQSDISEAGAKASHLVYLVDRAHRSQKRPAVIMYVALILIAAVILAGAGFWMGRSWGLH